MWVVFDKTTLALGPFLWYGGRPGEPFPDISDLPIAKHSKGNAQGVKAERPNMRVLSRKHFREEFATIPELVNHMFGIVVAAPVI